MILPWNVIDAGGLLSPSVAPNTCVCMGYPDPTMPPAPWCAFMPGKSPRAAAAAAAALYENMLNWSVYITMNNKLVHQLRESGTYP